MFVYWTLFALVALAALNERTQARDGRRPGGWLLILFAFLIVAMIGARYEVGADYWQYINIFMRAGRSTLERAVERGDPAYQALNWIVARAGFEQWVVNLICGAIFTWGLARFVRAQPAPMAALLVAVPYLVIVVAMGYTRQSVAIGLIMAGLAPVVRGGSVIRFAFYVAVAATFHRTAIVVLPLVLLAGQRGRLVNLLTGAAVLLLLYDLLLSESVESLVENYIEARYGSQGAAIRVAMSALPAVIVLAFGRRLQFDRQELATWRYFAIASLAMVPLLFILPSTTAVDRVALYFLPIQIAVIPRLIELMASPLWGRMAIVGYSLAIQFVWLNFAAHAKYWIPYRTVVGEDTDRLPRQFR